MNIFVEINRLDHIIRSRSERANEMELLQIVQTIREHVVEYNATIAKLKEDNKRLFSGQAQKQGTPRKGRSHEAPFAIDASWTSTVIPIDGGNLSAFYRQLSLEEDRSNAWQQKYWASVVSGGGILVSLFHDPIRYVSGVTPRGANTYKGILIPSELWYLPRCSFEESLECLGFFGFPAKKDRFPGAEGVADPVKSAKKVRELLLRMAVDRALTLNRLFPHSAQFELVKGRPFTKEEMQRVLEFNALEFAAKRESWEQREYIKTFLGNKFFVVGCF